jgi:hypothetical protein
MWNLLWTYRRLSLWTWWSAFVPAVSMPSGIIRRKELSLRCSPSFRIYMQDTTCDFPTPFVVFSMRFRGCTTRHSVIR